ncbi:glycosyltransferase family 2 protein [Dyella kyungheensis]|uniref:Glycosyltransferase family 2 protein n=1 Tax=Dyella kyungheensis TaxID=1242174 RepID=A0ABS2JKS3_9GAMM|nr:glycosyltransferase [Dyella kyungheensis]MBM7119636.1 glycosyltransferase family 2 protein [Dyella kyungheensis]
MSVNARDWSRRRPFPVTVRLPFAAANDSRVHRRHYVPVCLKFVLALVLALAWAVFAYAMAQHWMGELTPGRQWTAHLLVIGVAVLPAFMHVFLAVGLLLDRRPPRSHFADDDFPSITILIAAHNEQDSILDTLASIAAQRYPARIEVMVINDGSTDATLERLHSVSYPWLEVLDLQSAGGKANALNAGLRLASCPLTVTLDADAHLQPHALRRLVTRYMSDPPNTVAVAGAVLVRNSRQSLVTRMQEWDYFQGIAASKRLQSLFQGTLVAPGTFSLYRTDILRVVGGWPSCAGEDTVLTWAILQDHHRVGYCEDAIAFARVPASLASFLQQRQQWARGLIEAFKAQGSLLFRRRLSTFFIGWNLLFPYMDLAYTIALIPAVLLACTGVYWLAGAMLAFVLPASLLANLVVYAVQARMFRSVGLTVRRNPFGLFGYAMLYGLVLKPASVMGYLSGLLGWRPRDYWR